VIGLATQLEEVQARGAAAIRADVVAKAHHLNVRQSAVLAELLSAGRLTVADLEAAFPGVNRRTLQRDLKALVDKGLALEAGTGPTDPSRHYLPGKL